VFAQGIKWLLKPSTQLIVLHNIIKFGYVFRTFIWSPSGHWDLVL